MRASTQHPHLWIGAIMMVALMGTALVSPLYPLYREAWQLSAGDISLLYVIYMFGALGSLLVCGRLADRWGYRKTLTLALGLSFIGTGLSVLADGFYLFSTGRFLLGVAASMVTGAASVALAKLTPERHKPILAVMTSVFIALGFGIGPLIGGIAGQWLPYPLISAQIPSLILVLLSLLVLARVIPVTTEVSQLRWRDLLPTLSWADQPHALRFSLACGMPFLAFGLFGLYASMAPMMIRDFTGLSGPIVIGLTMCAYLVCSSITQVLSRKRLPKHNALISLALMATANLCMLINTSSASLTLFVACALITAISHGLGILSSTAVLHEVSPVERRGGLTSTYWAIGYSGAIFPILAMGWIADQWDLTTAVRAFCVMSAVLAVTLLLLITWLIPSKRATQSQ